MIKILIPIMILLMSTASGLTFSISTTNDFGVAFKDSWTTHGDVNLNGGYSLDDMGIGEGLDAQIGAGAFSERTIANHPGGHHQAYNFNTFKEVENVGSGTAYSCTQASTYGEMANIDSYLQTNSGIDHGEMSAMASNGAPKDGSIDFTRADWHFENVQAETVLEGSSWDDHTYTFKLDALGYP